jgi:hypothetical protein
MPEDVRKTVVGMPQPLDGTRPVIPAGIKISKRLWDCEFKNFFYIKRDFKIYMAPLMLFGRSWFALLHKSVLGILQGID